MTPSVQPLKSSILSGYSYDPKTYVLYVEFKSGQQREYYNVLPPVVSQVFDSSGSIGSKFHKLIKAQGYQSKEV